MNQFEIRRSFLSCLVIESDESSRWMLSFLLQNSGFAQIGAECSSLEMGLVRLDALRLTNHPVDVILLGSTLETLDALAPVVQAIAAFAPDLPIVILGQMPASPQMAEALGGMGYWWKGDRPEELLRILHGLQPALPLVKPSRVVVSPAIAALGRLSRVGMQPDYGLIDSRFGIFDRSLAQLDLQLRTQRLNRPTRWFLQGRIREIVAARWVAQQLLPYRQRSIDPRAKLPVTDLPVTGLPAAGLPVTRSNPDRSLPSRSSTSIAPQPPSTWPSALLRRTSRGPSVMQPLTTGDRSIPSAESNRLGILFDQFIVKLDAAQASPLGSLGNLSALPLEIDVLTDVWKVTLLSLVAQVLQTEINSLRSEGLSLSEWHDRIPTLLEIVWERVMGEFFRSAPDLTIPLSSDRLASDRLGPDRLVPDRLAQSLLRSRPFVRSLLNSIPLVPDWITYGVLNIPLSLDQQPYAPGSPQADRRALLLLENTILQLANAVIQPLLNQFSEVEAVKHRYFQIHYASSRELARFRNDLSWRYRRDRWFDTPTDIFESQYRILHLSDRGIAEMTLYAPRQEELQTLSGFPLVVTLVLETRDAIAPRLKATFSFLGSGVVYVLTEVVGRGIGLVGQGILKGIGNAWQERR